MHVVSEIASISSKGKLEFLGCIFENFLLLAELLPGETELLLNPLDRCQIDPNLT